MPQTDRATQIAESNLNNSSTDRRPTRAPASAGDMNSNPRQSGSQQSNGIDAGGFRVYPGTPVLIVASVPADSPWVSERVELPESIAGQEYHTGATLSDFGIDVSRLRNQLLKSGTVTSVTKDERRNGRVTVRIKFRPGRHPSREVAEEYRRLAMGILSEIYNKGNLSALYQDGEQKAVRLKLKDTGNDCRGVHKPYLEDGSLFLR